MDIIAVSIINFSSRSALKRDFQKGLIPLKKDITGRPLKRDYASLDHTIPKSKGGASNLYNYTIMDSFINNKRGSKPIKEFIDLDSLVDYIRIMLNVKTEDIDGVEYIKGWLKTLSKALKEGL